MVAYSLQVVPPVVRKSLVGRSCGRIAPDLEDVESVDDPVGGDSRTAECRPSVGYRSIDVSSSSQTRPPSEVPAHRTMAGTRMPPSQVEPFAPRSGRLLPPRGSLDPQGGGTSPSEPLSLVKITMVRSSRSSARNSSRARTSPSRSTRPPHRRVRCAIARGTPAVRRSAGGRTCGPGTGRRGRPSRRARRTAPRRRSGR